LDRTSRLKSSRPLPARPVREEEPLPKVEEGVVRRVLPGRALVQTDLGSVSAHVRGALKGGPRQSVHVVVVGDRVRIRLHGPEEAWLEEVLPRRNVVSRVDPGDKRGERRHDLAANLDQLCVMVSVDRPRFNPRGVDRLLVLGEFSGVPPLLILNKTDLCPAEPAVSVLEQLEGYRSIGYAALAVSAREGSGLEEVRSALAGRLSLLLGPSGVGKSTLLNVLYGLRLRTGEVSRATAKGVHTTTRIEWVDLPGGGAVLDSPGIRSIHPAGLTRRNLASCFPEIRALPPCQFGDCRHLGEAGCAVPAAVEGGAMHPDRYASYLRLLQSLPA